MTPKLDRGRPRKYRSSKSLQEHIEEYFRICNEQEEPYGIAALCMHLGITKPTFYAYQERGTQWKYLIEMARLRIEAQYERMLLDKSIPTTGVQFTLKCNYGWLEKQDKPEHVNRTHLNPTEMSDEELERARTLAN